jgi:hypothetical protein
MANQVTVFIHRSACSSSAEARGSLVTGQSCHKSALRVQTHNYRAFPLPHVPGYSQRTRTSARFYCLRILGRHLGAQVVFVAERVLRLSGEQALVNLRPRLGCSAASLSHYSAERSNACPAHSRSAQLKGLLLASRVQHCLHGYLPPVVSLFSAHLPV